MKRILLAAIFCAVFSVSSGFSQQCGQGRFTLKTVFDKPTYPPQEVNYQLYFVYPKNKREVSMEKLWDHASKFYYGKSDKDAGLFWEQFDGDKNILRVPKQKAEKYIKNYKPADYQKLASKFEEKFIKQLSGRSEFSTIVFRTLEQDDTPFLLKIEKAGYQYLRQFFLGQIVPPYFVAINLNTYNI